MAISPLLVFFTSHSVAFFALILDIHAGTIKCLVTILLRGHTNAMTSFDWFLEKEMLQLLSRYYFVVSDIKWVNVSYHSLLLGSIHLIMENPKCIYLNGFI